MEKIRKLKKLFHREQIDGYLIPKNDEFFGEYVPRYNDRLNYISNFSGSYGFCLILKNNSYLFVDGRYTLQANAESGKTFKIITFPNKMPSDIIKNKNLTIGIDPKLFTKKILTNFFQKSMCKFKLLNNNLVDKVWRRKITKKNRKIYKLPNSSIGQDYRIKRNKIIFYLKKNNANFLFITASENNAWLLNIRGNDNEFTPVPHCYILIDNKKNIIFFCDLKKITKSFKKNF